MTSKLPLIRFTCVARSLALCCLRL